MVKEVIVDSSMIVSSLLTGESGRKKAIKVRENVLIKAKATAIMLVLHPPRVQDNVVLFF